jgi:hypothetical protein
MTGETDPVLSDPARERLAHHSCPCCASGNRPDAFAKPVRVLTYVFAVLGLVLAFGVFWYVFTEMR